MFNLSSCKKLSFIVAGAFAANAAFAFDVTNNTVVGLSVQHGGPQVLVEYDFAGNITETLAVTGMPGTGVGVAVIGSNIFVSDNSGNIGQVDLTTGAMFNIFSSTSNEGLGDNGTDLLGLDFSGNVIRFSTGGSTLGSTTVANGGTGVDGDATGIWVGMYGTAGDALRYDYAGNLVTTVTTGISSNSVSGLGWDPTGGNLWISTGFGDDRIRSFDLNGNMIANFDSQVAWINGLDVVTDAVPEPATMAILAVGGFLAARRRRK